MLLPDDFVGVVSQEKASRSLYTGMYSKRQRYSIRYTTLQLLQLPVARI